MKCVWREHAVLRHKFAGKLRVCLYNVIVSMCKPHIYFFCLYATFDFTLALLSAYLKIETNIICLLMFFLNEYLLDSDDKIRLTNTGSELDEMLLMLVKKTKQK